MKVLMLDIRKKQKSFRGHWLTVFIFAGLAMGCSERKDPLSELTPEERWARPEITWTAEQLQQLDKGYQAYRGMCAACHLTDGQGQALVGAPALNKNPLVTSSDKADVIKLVLSGRNTMPSFKSLNDDQLADILSYVRNAWDNRSNDTLSAKQVSQIRSSLKPDI
jgi:mono/diheme cytochrome c family protein